MEVRKNVIDSLLLVCLNAIQNTEKITVFTDFFFFRFKEMKVIIIILNVVVI